MEQEEVIDIYNIVKGLANPADDLAWIGVLSSPIFGVSLSAIYSLKQLFPSDTFLDALSKSSSSLLQENGGSETDCSLLERAQTLVFQWIQLRPITGFGDLVKRILDDTQSWALYASKGPQTTQNI